jgi:hypothetical protein
MRPEKGGWAMLVYVIDPGYEQSALVAMDGCRVVRNLTVPNTEMLAICRDWHADWLVIEQIESMGMAVGKETFGTVWWAGRFFEAWQPKSADQVTRREVKLHLCGTMRAKDANIRQALIDRFGGSKEAAIGTKAKPGPLYGLKAHEFAALAVAVTWYDQHGGDDGRDRNAAQPSS